MYIGNDLQVAFPSYRNIDDISGSFNGVLTSFALLINGSAPVPFPLSSNQCLISVNGVIQKPDDTGTTGFRLSSGNIVFSAAPSGGATFFGVVLAGADYVNAGVNFPDGSFSAPSITFDQDNDTGYYRSASGAISFSSNGVASGTWNANGVSAPALSPTGSSVPTNGVYLPAANSVAISTNSVERVKLGTSEVVFNDDGVNYDFRIEGDTNSSLFFVDASADKIGIGTTSPVDKLHVSGGGFVVTGAYSAVTNNGGGLIGGFSGTSSTIYSLDPGVAWKALEIGSNTTTFNISGTERARIDSSGRLLVGTSSARASAGVTGQIQLEGTTYNNSSINLINNGNDNQPPYLIFGKQRSGSVGGATVVQSGDYLGRIDFAGGDGTDLASTGAWIGAIVDGTPGADDLPTRLVFSTTIDGGSSPTERMRIKNNGESWIVPTLYGLVVSTAASAGTTYTAYEALYGGGTVDTGTLAFRVFTNGNVQNTNNSYTAISDAKLKENIVDASSQWADIKALQVRNYNLKEGQTHRQIGLVAQEVEPISPGLVYESPDRDAEGNDLGTVTKSVNYSVLYMKAVKALQEAMERIETLEAKVAALEAA